MCIRSDLLSYMKAQTGEILSELNRWFTGIAVGHDPTPDECAWHYINNGGAEAFAKRWKKERRLAS